MSTFSFSSTAIDVAQLQRELNDSAAGGYVSFEGWVRNHNEGQQVTQLEYEAFEALAIKEGERIIDEAKQRFGILRPLTYQSFGLRLKQSSSFNCLLPSLPSFRNRCRAFGE